MKYEAGVPIFLKLGAPADLTPGDGDTWGGGGDWDTALSRTNNLRYAGISSSIQTKFTNNQ